MSTAEDKVNVWTNGHYSCQPISTQTRCCPCRVNMSINTVEMFQGVKHTDVHFLHILYSCYSVLNILRKHTNKTLRARIIVAGIVTTSATPATQTGVRRKLLLSESRRNARWSTSRRVVAKMSGRCPSREDKTFARRDVAIKCMNLLLQSVLV